jgi:signal transduction histidine kinase/ligand-binding sensor domain-containing protein
VLSPFKIILLLSLFISLNQLTLSAQKTNFYIFRNISTAAGLASDDVTSIIQDKKGYIWISTGNGLQKFDGMAFTNYHYDPYDSQSISSDNAGFLQLDHDGNIWIFSTFWGFNIFTPSSGKNTRVSAIKDPAFKNLNNSTNACLDNQGNTWLISLNTIAKYEPVHHKVVSYDYLLPKEKAFGASRSIICDPHTGNLWIDNYVYGICMLDPKKNVLYNKMHNPENLPIFNLISDPGLLFIDSNNNLWINSFSGDLYRYNLITHQHKKFNTQNLKIQSGKLNRIIIDCMMQDRIGNIWMGARKEGLLRYFPQSDSFSLIPRNSHAAGGLDYTEYLHCLLEDKEGNIWIGSDKGVSIFNPSRLQFQSVNLPLAKNELQSTAAVLNFLQSKTSDIWVATYGQGLQIFDQHLQFKTSFTYRKNNLGAIGDSYNRVWSFLTQPDGKVFIGCQHGWLSIYDPKYGNFINVQPTALNKCTIFNMALDSAQNTWFALYSGIAKWDHKNNSFSSYTDLLSSHGNTENQVFDILIDNKQIIWVATQTKGLQKFDPVTGRFMKAYVTEKNNPNKISDNSIQCITKINDSLLALGSASGGINIFNSFTEEFTHITTREGLPSNNITALYFQAPHDLWIGTIQGICKMNLESKRVFHYGIEDGILVNRFADCLRFYKTKNGRLLLGYMGGFVSFRPDSIGNEEAPANVTITGFKIYNQSLLVDSLLGKSDTVSLSYKQNFITLEFASLSFFEPYRINYYYQLQGVDKEWVNASRQRLASYANLSSGTYMFYVKSENRDGIPSQKITSICIIIQPPFWQTIWFKFLVLVVIVLLLYGLYKFRINQLLKLQAMRNEISKDLHDDLGATLGSINILSEVAKNKIESGDGEQTHSLLTKISSHSREMVDKMSDIVWAINPKNENVEKIIQRLSNFAQGICALKDIQLELKTDNPSLQQVLPMESMKNIYLIIKEAMNNAIKHSNCHQLTVSVRSIQGVLEIQIVDNGIGFDPHLVKTGNGLINMESRVKEMKGSFSIHAENKNTVVTLQIPIT